MSYSNPATQDDVDKLENKLTKKLDFVLEKLDWLIGKYKSHDEEHTLLNGSVNDLTDRVEKVENKLGISP